MYVCVCVCMCACVYAVTKRYGEEPFHGMKSLLIQEQVRDGLTLQQPPGCPDNVFKLMVSERILFYFHWEERERDA